MKRALIVYWIIFIGFLVPFILGKNIIALADSFHDLIDAISITFSFYIDKIAGNRSSIFTYGLHRLEIISALINFMVIIFGSVFTLYLSFTLGGDRYSLLVILLSFVAIFLLLTVHEDDENNLNRKAVVIHSLFDTIAYVIGIVALVLSFFINSRLVIISATALIVILSVLFSFNSLKRSLLIILEGSPVDTEKLEKDLQTINPGVHHVHVWAICGHINVATIHIEVNENMTIKEVDSEREKIEKILREKYNINHVTIQFESKRVD